MLRSRVPISREGVCYTASATCHQRALRYAPLLVLVLVVQQTTVSTPSPRVYLISGGAML